MALADFAEVRLDLGVDYGVEGGPTFQTVIAVTASGREKANAQWAEEMGRWDAGSRLILLSKLTYLREFFRARRGRAQRFRFKDWSDWKDAGQPLGVPLSRNGSSLRFQLQRVCPYDASYVRSLKKPVAGTTVITRNGATVAGVVVDTTTGIVEVPVIGTAAILSISKANPGVIKTTAPHGLATGAKVWIDGIAGMTQLNGANGAITVTAPDEFNLGIDTSGYGAYASGGTVYIYLGASQAQSWAGEFDKPVRFDTDQFRASFDAYDDGTGDAAYMLQSLPIVEVRL